jgi:poly(U)-binding-splicing factor PUF60
MTNVDDPTASLEQQIEVTVRGKDQRLMLMQKLMQRKQESRILILRNMVGPEDVDDELENEITGNYLSLSLSLLISISIKDECGKYGEVEQVVIYKEKQGEEDEAETIVKIFVDFLAPNAVGLAMNALNGRYFAGRLVKAEIYDQTAYNSKDYSG